MTNIDAFRVYQQALFRWATKENDINPLAKLIAMSYIFTPIQGEHVRPRPPLIRNKPVGQP